MQVALENFTGRAILNSVHLEAGRGRWTSRAALSKHGAASVALTID